MATTADLKNGMYIMFNGKPCVVVYFQHVKPGKGPAFVKTKLRNLENGRILENTFTAGVKLDTISVERRPYQFLYSCLLIYVELTESLALERILQEYVNVGARKEYHLYGLRGRE